MKINISPTDRPQWHTPAEIRAAAAEGLRIDYNAGRGHVIRCRKAANVSADTDAVTGEDTRGECWTWYTDAGDYRSGDRVQLTFDGPAVIDATPAG